MSMEPLLFRTPSSFMPPLCGLGFHLISMKRPISLLSRLLGPISANRPRFNSSNSQLDSDLFDDMFGPSKDPYNLQTARSHIRTSYGEDGELLSTLPCPDCRGRGYIVCPQCEISLDLSCTQCAGKGLTACLGCLGNRVAPVPPQYDTLWEEKKIGGPVTLPIEDDEIIDNMDIQVPPRKSKRIYTSPSQDVREKIRQALKALDARTGSVTRRMRRIHSDPILSRKRIAAIKKAKSSEASRKAVSEKLRQYFQDPANRLKRSLSLRGVDYYCSNCGEKGHRCHYCPSLSESERANMSYRCGICGQEGHNRASCPSKEVSKNTKKKHAHPTQKKRDYRCSICKEIGHNARKCPSIEISPKL